MGIFGLEFMGGLLVDIMMVVSSLVIGLVVMVVSAVLFVWWVGWIVLVVVMCDDVVFFERSLWVCGIIGSVLIVLGVVVMVYGVGVLEGSDVVKVFGVGAFFMFIGMIVVALLLSWFVLYLFGALGVVLLLMVGKLVCDNMLCNLCCMVIMVILLMIGLVLVLVFVVIVVIINVFIDKFVDD